MSKNNRNGLKNHQIEAVSKIFVNTLKLSFNAPLKRSGQFLNASKIL